MFSPRGDRIPEIYPGFLIQYFQVIQILLMIVPINVILFFFLNMPEFCFATCKVHHISFPISFIITRFYCVFYIYLVFWEGEKENSQLP